MDAYALNPNESPFNRGEQGDMLRHVMQRIAVSLQKVANESDEKGCWCFCFSTDTALKTSYKEPLDVK